MFDALTGTHRYGVAAALCWTEAELEEIRAYDASVDDEDKARPARRETDRRYYEKNKEKINAYSREYAKANREKYRAYRRAYYQRHKEQERERVAEYRASNRDEINRKKREKWKEGKR